MPPLEKDILQGYSARLEDASSAWAGTRTPRAGVARIPSAQRIIAPKAERKLRSPKLKTAARKQVTIASNEQRPDTRRLHPGSRHPHRGAAHLRPSPAVARARRRQAGARAAEALRRPVLLAGARVPPRRERHARQLSVPGRAQGARRECLRGGDRAALRVRPTPPRSLHPLR